MMWLTWVFIGFIIYYHVGAAIITYIDKDRRIWEWALTGPFGLGPTICILIWPWVVYRYIRYGGEK